MRNTLIFLFAGACVALLAGCGTGKLADAQRDAVATLGKELPVPYRDGLITASAQQQGNDLVLVIHFAEATVAMAKAKPDLFDALRLDEQAAIGELCDDKTLAPVLAAGGNVRRRFLDRDGALFFEATLTPSDCPSLP